jgi:signal transduction histidine kinase
MSESISLRYVLAFCAVLIAFVVGVAVNPLLGDRVLYVLLVPAIAFSAWYCGIGPSIFAISLSVLAAMYGFTLRPHPFHTPKASEYVALLAFLFSSILILALGESRRRHNEKLRTEQGELETKVRERTVELDTVNRNLRELSARLLQLQDEERRRIARELHDSVGQMLAALTMNLSTVRADVEHLAKTAAALTDSESLVQEMSSEVRTISHLLHPPLLDEAGLSSALRWYVDGFAQRSKINVDLDLPRDFARMPHELETAIFRVVQECLTNVHRHSGSATAKIRLRAHDGEVLVEVEDKGKGMPPEKRLEIALAGTPGVGISGMRERLRQLGGTLEINSNGSGTAVIARLPVSASSASGSIAVSNSPAAA